MVRRILICAIFVISTLSIASAANIDGTWKGKVNSPQGEMELVLSVKVVNADSLVGTIQAPMGELPILNGKVAGENFTFDIDFNGITVHPQGTVQNDTLTVRSSVLNGPEMVMVFTRVKDDKKSSSAN